MNCPGCGTQFQPRGRQRRCKKDCGRTYSGRSSVSANGSRAIKRAEHDVTFTAVDGEGITLPDGRHEYVLLSVGAESLHRDGAILGHEEIFNFLYGHFEGHPDNAYVGFFLGYDFTQWLRDIRPDRAFMLLHKQGIKQRQPRPDSRVHVPFPVRDGHWEYDILGDKRFRLRPEGDGNKWMYVCDAGSFFQCSFLTAIDPAKWTEPVCTPEEYATILEGKGHRSTAGFDYKMINYNVTENAVMERLMRRYNQGLVKAEIRLRKNQWFGPGQAAQQWLDNIGAPTSEQVYDVTPRWAVDAARNTYYGGWFEIFAHGHVPGESYEYDINSAYPWIISQLPCLLHGEWIRSEDHPGQYPPVGSLAMLRVRLQGRDPFVGPAQHRTPDGLIMRPLATEGWHWEHEIKASMDAGLIESIDVLEWVAYIPCDCPAPLRSIADLYMRRLQVGKNSPEGRALKLVYNSAYGKFAQSIGQPKYANAIYASLITAGCRTMILEAIASHPHGARDLLMVATDGVYFRTPHPGLQVDGERLGAWDAGVKHNLTLFMPGIYWDDKTRAAIRDGKAPALKSRGISARDLTKIIDTIDQQFTDRDGGWPTAEVPVEFSMISAKQAITRGKWGLAGSLEHGKFKAIDSDPSTKRDPRTVHLDGDLIRTLPYERATTLETTPYDGRFGQEVEEIKGLEGLTPDAESVQEALAWALKTE